MTIKMLMGEQFQPLGAPLNCKEPEKPDPIAAFERGNHAGPDGDTDFDRISRIFVGGVTVKRCPALTRWGDLVEVKLGRVGLVRIYGDGCHQRSDADLTAEALEVWIRDSKVRSPSFLDMRDAPEQVVKLARDQAGRLGVTFK